MTDREVLKGYKAQAVTFSKEGETFGEKFLHTRVLTKTRKYDHISPILALCHWLPMGFKILLLVFKSLIALASPYINDLLAPYSPARSPRSADKLLLSVCRVRLKTEGLTAVLETITINWLGPPPNPHTIAVQSKRDP